MKTTIYELLGMIKDGKAPKKIKYDEMIWKFEEDKLYFYENIWLEDYCNLTTSLNDEVEIIEEENKIPEKIEKITISEDEKSLFFDDKYQDISLHNISPIEVAFAIKINEIIDKINGDDK